MFKKNTKKIRFYLTLLAIAIALPVTVITLQHKQIATMFAQGYSTPPMFGCLTMGESNSSNCGTKLLDARLTFDLNLKPIKDIQTVYYGDIVFGAISGRNTGDLPVDIKGFGAQGVSGKSEISFEPQQPAIVLEPGKAIALDTIYHRFDFPDPAGEWTLSANITNAQNQLVQDLGKTKIKLIKNCTALRAKILTDADRTKLMDYCSKNPDKKLCTSKEYCEIFTNNSCPQPLSNSDDVLECNESVILPEKEQVMLEEFCKDNMSIDVCKDFCDRTIGSSICPTKYLTTDTTNIVNQSKTVAGAKTTLQAVCPGNKNCRPGQLKNYCGECCAAGTCLRPSAAGNMLCSRACGAPGPAPAPGSSTPKSKQFTSVPVVRRVAVTRPTCQTKNRIGQCCKYNGPLRSTGQCPLGPGGGGSAPAPAPVVRPIAGMHGNGVIQPPRCTPPMVPVSGGCADTRPSCATYKRGCEGTAASCYCKSGRYESPSDTSCRKNPVCLLFSY